MKKLIKMFTRCKRDEKKNKKERKIFMKIVRAGGTYFFLNSISMYFDFLWQKLTGNTFQSPGAERGARAGAGR